jgi:flagellar hook protein FlgE
MSFNTALSGLKVAQSDLGVVSNNIANASTVGFKTSRAEFADVFAGAGGGVSKTAIGSGVTLTRVAQQFKQGSLSFTGNSLDLAVSGKGFFVMEQDGAVVYTRAGQFGVDRDGFVVNSYGQKLMAYPPTEGDESVFQTGLRDTLSVPSGQGAPEATNQVDIALNVSSDDDGFGTDSASAAEMFDPSDPETFNRSTSVTVYDSFGSSHVASIFFQRVQDGTGTNTNNWNAFVYVDAQLDGTDTDITGDAATDSGGNPMPTAHVLTFDDTGKLASLTQPDGTVSLAPSSTADYSAFPFTPGGGAADMTLDINYDAQATTQYSGAFVVSSLKQDGVPPGRLIGLNISDEGVVFARFSNGSSEALGKVALADFDNPQGLSQLGDAAWAESFESGIPRAGEPGQGSFGTIKSGALEGSNVELTDELVKLITAQRNFQANARAIETNNNLTQSIIQIR